AGREAGGEPASAWLPDGGAGVVDSIVPIAVALERFREGLEEPGRLRSGIRSRDALVERLLVVLAAADTAAFEELAVDRAEYAWLYYPESPISRPPYELPPALAWFRLQQGNRVGALRALRELGGRPLDHGGYRCAEEPAVEGRNRIWVGCAVEIGRDGEPAAPIRLFGSILERDGRFAILSFAND